MLKFALAQGKWLCRMDGRNGDLRHAKGAASGAEYSEPGHRQRRLSPCKQPRGRQAAFLLNR